MKLIYGVKDKPKVGQTIVFAHQQLLAIMAATLVVPVIVGHGMQPTAALFGAGIGTLVYLLFTKFRSPVFLGSSFAFLGSMAAAFAGGVSAALGYLGLIIGAVLAGLVYVIIAIIVKFAGTKWINKLMPAVVIGPTVAIIGLCLAGNAIGDLQKVNYTEVYDNSEYQIVRVYDTHEEIKDENGNTVKYKFTKADENLSNDGVTIVVKKDADIADLDAADYYQHIQYNLSEKLDKNGDPEKDEAGNTVYVESLSSTPGSVYVAIVCGLVTLAVTMLCSVYAKKKSIFRLIPFIIGICSGYVCALIFFLIGKATGNASLMIIDLSPFAGLLNDGKVTLETFVSLPKFTFLSAFGKFGELSPQYFLTIFAAYVPVAFVVFAEHLADHKNISSIIEKDLLEDPGLHRTLLGDGIGSMAGAFFGGCPNTTYGESIGCVAITGNASVITIVFAAFGAILISFLSPFVAFVNSIPSCVMGGVCMALYGFIAVSGLKMVQKVDLEENRNLFVVSVILIAGIGGLAISFGKVTITEIACALILGILTNLMLSGKKKEAVQAAEKEENSEENK